MGTRSRAVTKIIRRRIKQSKETALLTLSSLELFTADWTLEAGDGGIDPGEVESDIDLCEDKGRGEGESVRGRFEALDTKSQRLRLTFLTMHSHLAGSGCITTRLLSIALRIWTIFGCPYELTASRKCTPCRLCCISNTVSGHHSALFVACMCRRRPASST